MSETTAKTPKHLTPAGEASPSFPEQLILEILLRVPVRSLVRFRCVSKSWKTLISHPQFVKDHLRVSTTYPNMAHQRLASSASRESHKIASFPVQSLFRNPLTPYNAYCFETYVEYHIIGSCNGLLCLTDRHENYVTLCNPSMCLVSERLPLGFLPCFIFLGFGYDHVNDKYKLLGTSKLSRDDETVTKIYTFGADSWTVIPNFPHNPVQWRGKFVNGTLNWLSERGLSDDQWLIFYLDLTTETYGEMVLRDADRKPIFCPLLSVLRDCLCLSFYDTKKSHSVVWLMKEYGVEDSWTKLMIIPHHDPLLWPPFVEPLCISEDGLVLLKTRSFKLVRYNSIDGRLNYLGIKGNHWWDLRIYHESLVPLPC